MLKVTVIGAGTMGHGIAGQAAWKGCEVCLFDVHQDSLSKGLKSIEKIYAKGVARGKMSAEDQQNALQQLSGISTSVEDACTGADLVIEAVPENLELKQDLFKRIEAVVSEDTLLASNTSSLSITRIASALKKPQRFLGMHFFNPVAIMPLLEIVRGPDTTDQTVERVRELGQQWLKTPIVVKDSPGFATSRLGIALGNEAMRIFEEGVASAHDIDQAMVLGYRHPIGPLALTDLVGLDVRLAISEYLYQELKTDTFKPPQILKEKVAQGHLGKKSGQGFYEYNQTSSSKS